MRKKPSGSRQRLATAEPDGQDLTDFPVRGYPKGGQLYRCHRVGLGAWFFSSDMSGRFDVAVPWGTCYLARHKRSALREALGETLTRAKTVPIQEFEARLVSSLRLPSAVESADMANHLAANFGLTREITGDEDYALPQRWAAALRKAKFGGISYENRFDPGRDAESLAMFARSGPKKYRADKDPQPALASAVECGILTSAAPALATLTVIAPPAS